MLMHSGWRDGENPPPHVEFSVIQTRHHSAAVRSVAYSSDDAFVAVAGGSDVCISESISGRNVSRISMRRSNSTPGSETTCVQSVAFATLRDYGVYENIDGSQFEGNGPNRGQNVDSRGASPDSCASLDQGLLTAGTNGKVLLWNVREARLLASLLEVEASISSIAVSGATNLFVSGAVDGGIHIRPIRCGNTRGPSVEAPGGSGFISVAFSPTGAVVASGDCQGIAAAWDVESGQRMWSNSFQSARRSRDVDYGLLTTAFSPDGRLLLTGGYDGSVCLHDLAIDGEATIRIFATHPSHVQAIAFAPNGRWFISACADGAIRLWDPRFTSRVVETQFNAYRAPLLTVAHANFSKTFCSGDTSGTAHVCTYL